MGLPNPPPDPDDGDLTPAVGSPMAASFNFPLLPKILLERPFKLDGGSSLDPLEWNNTVYSSQRTNLSIPTAAGNLQTYYNPEVNTTYNASAVVKMSSGTQTCYFVVSGLATQADFGTGQMGKLNLIGALEAFMEGGLYTGQDKISQIPRVQITSPKVSDNFSNPSTITINWAMGWTRWDGTNYTSDYSAGYSESTPIVYAVKYSPDGGRTWKYCSDNTGTTIGDKDLTRTTTALTCNWSVLSLPKGSYLVRVECFRQNIGMHYAYDHVGIDISR